MEKIDIQVGALEAHKRVVQSVVGFHVRNIVPDLSTDGMVEIDMISDIVFGQLESILIEIDDLHKQVKFLADSLERLDEQLGNYDRGVSLQINEDSSN